MRTFTAAILFAAGCKGITEACTLVGCANGLLVEFDAAPTVPYRVEAMSGPTAARYLFVCAEPAKCTKPFFSDYMPTSVTITVTTDAGSKSFLREPVYTTSQPNGPRCGPTCRNSTVTVSLP